MSSCGGKDKDYVIIVDKITDEYKKNVILNHNLVLLGEGGGMMGDIQRTSLTFKKYDSLDIRKVRELAVELEEQYLKMINEDKAVRPYLHNYPAGPENFELTIIFGCLEGFVLPPYIANAVVLDGEVCYRTYNKEKKMLDEVFSDILLHE